MHGQLSYIIRPVGHLVRDSSVAELHLHAAKAHFGAPSNHLSQASLGGGRRERHFLDDSCAQNLSRPITSLLDITLRSQVTIDKSSFLLWPSTRARRMCLHSGPPA